MWACRYIAAELSDECLNQEIFYSLKEAVPIAATTEAPPRPSSRRGRIPEHAYLADRISNVLPLRHQNINLLKLRNDLFGLVSLPRSAAFSASSRLFDLNGAVKTASTKHSSAIIVC